MSTREPTSRFARTCGAPTSRNSAMAALPIGSIRTSECCPGDELRVDAELDHDGNDRPFVQNRTDRLSPRTGRAARRPPASVSGQRHLQISAGFIARALTKTTKSSVSRAGITFAFALTSARIALSVTRSQEEGHVTQDWSSCHRRNVAWREALQPSAESVNERGPAWARRARTHDEEER